MLEKNKNFIKQNSRYPRCVDGRPAVAFIEWETNKKRWIVSKKNPQAALEVGPQFLGASLLFVRSLQEVAYIDLEQSFALVEEASKKLGLGLQIHLDDHHGEINLETMNEKQIIEWFMTYQAGCGFAKFAWNSKANEIIRMTKDRKWRVQILTGEHKENGAILNHQKSKTFQTALGAQNKEAKFNTDLAEAEAMFTFLGGMMSSNEFAQKAMRWNIKTYQEVVIALGGVSSSQEIEHNTTRSVPAG